MTNKHEIDDLVNSPSHYRKGGMEVIDVIENYAKHDFRLANVLKYVCRAGYKGHPLQDLQKAQWYLNRVVSEMEELEAMDFELDGYYSFVYDEDITADPCAFTTEELEVITGPDRIAGDDEAAARVKGEYYEYAPGELITHCAACDKPIVAGQAYLTVTSYGNPTLPVCSYMCKLKFVDGANR